MVVCAGAKYKKCLVNKLDGEVASVSVEIINRNNPEDLQQIRAYNASLYVL